MAAKTKREKHSSNGESQSSLLPHLVLGGVAFLVVVTPLVSSEGSPERGAELWLAVGWSLLLTLWGATAIMKPKLELRWSWPETCLLGFVLWLALSTWFVAGEGNLRSAFNGFWDHAHLLIAYFLIRQCIVTEKQRSAILSAMICLAVFVSTFAIYQYRVELPAQRAAYDANPEQVLIENGIDPDPNNPVRALFESRLDSTEPTATFTLTNSLAGFLVPWLLLSIGWLKNAFSDGPNWKRVGGLTLAVTVVCICLLLTKSRTAWLASLFGLTVLGFYASGIGRRVSWVIPAAGLTAILGIFMLGFATGVLDVEVLSEAPKSVLYRLQYWQGAAAIVASNPVFGCGLANFQGYYPEFMLPMASETVADPHNFVFEIWATAGTPALLLFLAAMTFWVIRLAKSHDHPPEEVAPQRESEDVPNSSTPIALGAALAFPFAPMLQMIMQEVSPDFMPQIVGLIPTLAVAFALSQGTSQARNLRLYLIVAISALVVDLLAAGGISFPSVAGSLYLLAAVASPAKPTVVLDDWRGKGLPLAIGAVGLLVVTLWGIQPSQARRTQMGQSTLAARQGNWKAMEQHALLATQADPWSKEGPSALANIYYQGWTNNSDAPLKARKPLLDSFDESLAMTFRRAGRSFPLHFSAGNWYLDIYRQSNNPQHLLQATDHYRQAAKLFPNRAIHHAQLAWALHLAGLDEESSAEAEEALRLDALNPHVERSLEKLKIHDPGPFNPNDQAKAGPSQELSAKQVVENLRTMGG
ncbi:O-antigen ligase family protein [Bremerella sp. T1]|uniref:O-antigen ligase family protein n=1 Tax=Bremerella sp. TYQ1 TaxID=3119568 RepID=UPI001CD00F6E|nr:O-antigen ligase family protein [Bremerella volcania]UBM37950.1 O-antigen ligase family protein [Bremerella volcania]